MKKTRLAVMAILFLGLASTFLLHAQSDKSNFNSHSDKSASFEATAQLMNAVLYGGSAETVKLLIAKGADVNAKDNEGWHALQLASKRGDVEIVRLLIEKGADVNATNQYGVASLTSAASRGYMDVVKLLVEKGADVNAKDNHRETPLMFAAMAGQTNSVLLLLNKGADINATNNYGASALMEAVNEAKLDTVKLLLSKGADINIEDGMGLNALDDAKTIGNTAILQLLKKAGAVNSSSAKQDEELTASIKKLQESSDALSKSFGNYHLPESIPMSSPASFSEKRVKPGLIFGTNADSSGYVTNASLLTPFTVTNSAGVVFTNAVLVKLMPNKFVYQTPGGSMGTLRLNLLPEDLLKKIGYDPQMAQAADENENLKKARQQELAQHQRELAAQQANVPDISDVPAFEVLTVTAKPTEQNEMWWRYGYRLTVRNNGQNTGGQRFHIQFLDAQGYVIDTTTTDKTAIRSGATEIITGETLLTLPGAARVAKLKATWRE